MRLPENAAPRVTVLSLGGTIGMASVAHGGPVVPVMTVEDLVSAVPGLGAVARIETSSLASVPSPSMTVDLALEAFRRARESTARGADGIVLTHGTDTLEETAYLLDLLWDMPVPLVVTGAMRSPGQLGADGPANLMDAVLAASSCELRGLGVLVAMAGEIHLARYASKVDTAGPCAFASPGWGPVARVIEDRVRVAYRPHVLHAPLPLPSAKPIEIPIIEAVLDDTGSSLRAALALDPHAIVVAGAGGGHVSQEAAEACDEILTSGTPLVLASRAGRGPVLSRTYGYRGSETDLLSRGAISAGFLPPRKARILSHVVLASGGDNSRLVDELSARGA